MYCTRTSVFSFVSNVSNVLPVLVAACLPNVRGWADDEVVVPREQIKPRPAASVRNKHPRVLFFEADLGACTHTHRLN